MPDTIRIDFDLLKDAFHKRDALFSDTETNAYRLFNGFYEGCPAFSVDRYGDTAVILWQSKHAQPDQELLAGLRETCLNELPGIGCVLFKNRYAADESAKKGKAVSGEHPARSVREWGVTYSIDLQVNKDCGFYLDSSLLRKWLLENARGKRVLNTFAYTGSLGDAASAGGALSVTQTDINHNYLAARHSDQEYIFGDFFHVSAMLRRADRLFDLVILDPPFFARAGRSAVVDQARNAAALINKIRPLAAHDGKIIVLNNALFLSGKDFLSRIETLCDPYLSISQIIPVPGSFFGFSPIRGEDLPADPAPFNHPTKIIVLDVRRKDGKC